MVPRLLLILAAITAMFVAGSTAVGTILIPKTLRELVVEADLIVVGRITGESVAWVDGPNSVIFTHWNLEVERTVKGKPVKSVILSEVGGTIGDVACAVASMPRYKVGDRVYLPLKKDALGFWRTHGLIQGKFHLQVNRLTGDELVTLPAGHSHVWRGEFRKEQVSPAGNLLIEEFDARVQVILAEIRKNEPKNEEKK